uniref:phosphoribosylpyrophosphate synthetase n=1 Tax=Fulvivirga sp. TaxID=1931237 RepID=UPI004049CAF9
MSKHDLHTVVEVLDKLKKEGFKDDFEFSNHSLKRVGHSKPYKVSEVEVVDEFRFEGETNPSDSSILYALKTDDGNKGTLIDSYGPQANMELQNFIRAAS